MFGLFKKQPSIKEALQVIPTPRPVEIVVFGEAKEVDLFTVNIRTSTGFTYPEPFYFHTAEAAFAKYPNLPVTKRTVWRMPNGTYIEIPRALKLTVNS